MSSFQGCNVSMATMCPKFFRTDQFLSDKLLCLIIHIFEYVIHSHDLKLQRYIKKHTEMSCSHPYPSSFQFLTPLFILFMLPENHFNYFIGYYSMISLFKYLHMKNSYVFYFVPPNLHCSSLLLIHIIACSYFQCEHRVLPNDYFYSFYYGKFKTQYIENLTSHASTQLQHY